MRYRWDPAYPAYRPPRRPRRRIEPPCLGRRAQRGGRELSRHFADGRLDQAEFKARLDRAMGAVTRGDLDGLFDDLPRLADEPAAPRPRRRLFLPVPWSWWCWLPWPPPLTVSTIHVSWLLVVLAWSFLWHRAGHRPAPPDDQPELHR